MKILEEFKSFIFRGNVVDLAIGVIIGAAFGKLVTSLVENVLMPPIGYLTGNTDFNYLKIILKNGTGAEEIAVKYDTFIQDTVNFLIISFCIFILVKAINKLHKKEEQATAPSTEERLLTEIRDLLKSKS